MGLEYFLYDNYGVLLDPWYVYYVARSLETGSATKASLLSCLELYNIFLIPNNSFLHSQIPLLNNNIVGIVHD